MRFGAASRPSPTAPGMAGSSSGYRARDVGRGEEFGVPMIWCGSKLNRRGYAGFGPCFHLPGFHFGTGLLSRSHMMFSFKHKKGSLKKGTSRKLEVAYVSLV